MLGLRAQPRVSQSRLVKFNQIKCKGAKVWIKCEIGQIQVKKNLKDLNKYGIFLVVKLEF